MALDQEQLEQIASDLVEMLESVRLELERIYEAEAA